MLTISGDDITHLDSLYNLVSATEFTITGNGNLINLHGLEQFAEVTSGCCTPWDNFSIENNARLENIDALSALTSAGGSTSITSNPMLTNVDGLSSLNRVGGELRILNNASLTNLDGLSSLTTLGKRDSFGDGSLTIGNASLINIDGLSSLTQASFFVDISNNSVLPNLDGLSSFHFLGGKERGEFRLSNNLMLQNVDGLSNFTSVGPPQKALTVTGNLNLTKGCGLYPVPCFTKVLSALDVQQP